MRGASSRRACSSIATTRMAASCSNAASRHPARAGDDDGAINATDLLQRFPQAGVLLRPPPLVPNQRDNGVVTGARHQVETRVLGNLFDHGFRRLIAPPEFRLDDEAERRN